MFSFAERYGNRIESKSLSLRIRHVRCNNGQSVSDSSNSWNCGNHVNHRRCHWFSRPTDEKHRSGDAIVTQTAIPQTVTRTVSTTVVYTSLDVVLEFSDCSTVMNINGTEYCALDVSSDILLGNPGYHYFTTADAIVFNGVTFRTICPSGYEGCPNAVQNSTVTVVEIGAIRIDLAFQDKTNETVGSVLGDFSGNLTILSNHRNPRAGFSVEYVQPTGTNKGPLFRTFLLVQAESQQITTSASTVNGSCTHTMTYDGRETCSALMDYSTLNELVHDPNNSFTNYGNGTIILYVGHNACTAWFYYLPNETSVIEYLGVTGSETCGVPPNTLPLNTTLTQTTDSTTTVVVENLGGASTMRFDCKNLASVQVTAFIHLLSCLE